MSIFQRVKMFESDDALVAKAYFVDLADSLSKIGTHLTAMLVINFMNTYLQARIQDFRQGRALGLMTFYRMGMSDFSHTQTQICYFSRCSLPYEYYA